MSRKYGHRGYMDGDREAPRKQRPGEPREDRFKPSKPRGRGLGAPTEEVFGCAVCGAQQAPPAAGAFATVCAGCGADLHTCTNCSHFLTSARFECRQPVAERIAKKSHQNECELFAPKVAVQFASEPRREPDDPGSAFDALFKGI